jgi:enamine deaminase RidA (YjgF/YER057c/UK114 family)
MRHTITSLKETRMINLTIAGGGRFEEIGGYARVRRVGDQVYVAGTTAVEPSGRLHAPGDTYQQTLFVLGRLRDLLAEAGAGLQHVVLTRAYLMEGAAAGDFARAHGEVFADIRPVLTAVTAGLTVPGMMVEIEVQAVVTDDGPDPKLS